MADKTPIEWTDATWSPVLGCSPESAGCAHCYATRTVWRMAHNPNARIAGPRQGLVEKTTAGVLRWTGEVRCLPDQLDVPLRWREPRRIFVCNQADLFHESVPDDFIEAVFGVMSLCGRHTFQILTKRAERMRRWVEGATLGRCQAEACKRSVDIVTPRRRLDRADGEVINGPWPLPNVWLGVSVEDRRSRNDRIRELERTPAAVRFLSCEPLLEDLGDLALEGTGIRWVIVGGESGPGARPCDVAWVRSLVEQCRAAGVPAFCKQLGAHVLDRNDAGFDGDDGDAWPADTCVEHDEVDTGFQGAPVRVRLRDRKGGDPAEWPEDLRCREMPGTEEG